MNKSLFFGGLFWGLLLVGTNFVTLNCDPSRSFIMMSDGTKQTAIPVEEFLKIVKSDADDEGFDLPKPKKGISLPAIFKETLKDSIVVDTVKESFSGSSQAVKSVAKYIIKNIFVGATLGVIVLIGGAIAWKYIVVPAYCNGPTPTFARVFGFSDYWYGSSGICKNYVEEGANLDAAADSSYQLAFSQSANELFKMAQAFNQNGPESDVNSAEIRRDSNVQIPGYCFRRPNGADWKCEPSLCNIEPNLMGCPK